MEWLDSDHLPREHHDNNDNSVRNHGTPTHDNVTLRRIINRYQK